MFRTLVDLYGAVVLGGEKRLTMNAQALEENRHKLTLKLRELLPIYLLMQEDSRVSIQDVSFLGARIRGICQELDHLDAIESGKVA